MASYKSVLNRLRKICLVLPDTTEEEKWGEPHFCVCGKIFCGVGEQDGVVSIGFKLPKPKAAALVKLPGFSVAPYVGRHGWVSLDAEYNDDWADLRDLIHESYGLIAPRRTIKKLENMNLLE